MTKKQRKMLCRILIAALLTVLSVLCVGMLWLSVVLSIAAYLVVGYDILQKAVHGIRFRQGFDENFLMAVATVGAFCLREYTEATAVMLFYQVGELFQSYAVNQSRKSIGNLMQLRPDFAHLTDREGNLVKVPPEKVPVESLITILPGERIPLDGVVVSGNSSLDTSSLTGESLPREAAEGNRVASGCINLTGVLTLRTETEFSQSTVSRILELVESAGAKKSRSERFISRFAKFYTPIVCYSAFALALLPPVVSFCIGGNPEWGKWLYRALSFLVISCPCALVVSIPLSFFAAIGGAGRQGILIKGAEYLETLSQVRQVAFDKTGTLSQGVFRVTEISPKGISREELLEIAAHLEAYSQHPIGKSIVEAYKKDPDLHRVTDITEEAGFGVTGELDGQRFSVGSRKLMKALGIPLLESNGQGTLVHVAKEKTYLGCLQVSDVLKPQAAEAVSQLQRRGIRTVMLTGDRTAVGEEVGAMLGIDRVYAELLPENKVAVLEQLMAERAGKTAYAGDGINDAPVLIRADVGIAMGAMGSDAALEAADVVLMDDNPEKIAAALRISRKCMKIVRQNLVFAIGIKVLCLVLGAIGITNMWMAIFADVGVMVLAVCNAMRNLKSGEHL